MLLREAAATCSVTGKVVAPDEREVCGLSGALALPSEMEPCVEPPVRAIRKQLVRCTETGDWLSPAAAGRSDYHPRWVARRLLRQSEKPPGRFGTVDEFSVCAVTKKTLLIDELDRSAVSSALVDLDLLKPSAKSGSLALVTELVRCEETGAMLLPAETAICAASGRRVSIDLLERSPGSGRLCLRSLFITCPETGLRVPAGWLTAANDASAEFCLARGAVFLYPGTKGTGPVRHYLEPAEYNPKFRSWSWSERGGHVVWGGRDLARNLGAVVVRRLFKIRRFLKSGLRLRTACDLDVDGELKVTRPDGFAVPDDKALAGILKDALAACKKEKLFADPPVTPVVYEEK
jgi:hypothetical protein